MTIFVGFYFNNCCIYTVLTKDGFYQFFLNFKIVLKNFIRFNFIKIITNFQPTMLYIYIWSMNPNSINSLDKLFYLFVLETREFIYCLL